MSNAIKNRNAKDKETKDIPLEERVINEFVNQYEFMASGGYEDRTIPVTIRLEKYPLALLDHLAKRWRDNRSSIAAKLLEEMIWLVFRRVYEDKTGEELEQIQTKIYREFEEKQKKAKNAKVKKVDK